MAKRSLGAAGELVMRVALLVVLVSVLALAVPASADPVSGDPVCQTVASGPDFVMLLCVDLDASCRVYTVTYGHEGATSTRCVLA